MSQTRSTNPFRPGSGILAPLLAGHEHETAIFQGRIERSREGQSEHTALLDDWAIGKTTVGSAHPPPSGDIEAEVARRGVRPGATRQSLRRLVARGHIDRLTNGRRSRYTLLDRLFRRFLDLQHGSEA
ncbi:MAG: hypothetical protein M3Q66_09595 [Chloroflexota bacterium]|nr:hypothetical protein [Chloroflexota bacterium]